MVRIGGRLRRISNEQLEMSQFVRYLPSRWGGAAILDAGKQRSPQDGRAVVRLQPRAGAHLPDVGMDSWSQPLVLCVQV